jgi:hypothetical protein
MSDTSAPEPKSSERAASERLIRMLRSTLRRYPRAKLQATRGGFGVSLDEFTILRVCWDGPLSAADIRDLLALFAVWLVADPEVLLSAGTPLSGFSATVNGQRS